MKLKNALAWMCVMALSHSAHASLTHALVQSFPVGLPPGVDSYDLLVTVSAGDDWQHSQMISTALSGSFVDPSPVNINIPGFNDADTWFAATSAPPNSPGVTSFIFVSITPAGISAAWFDNTSAGAGTFTIARILVTSDAVFEISGFSLATLDPTPFPYFFTNVPSPGALALLGLSGLVGSRHRRR